MKKALTIFIGFIHDLATGIWAATVLAIYWLNRISHPRLEPVFEGLMKEFFYIGLVCIAVVFITGAGRTFTYAYIGEVYGADTEKLRRRMLIIKHIILIVVFGSGTFWQYTMTFK